MFDATAGRQASTDKIEARSNRIAANLEDRLKELSLDDQEALMDRLDAVVASTDTTKSFVAGTYAQDSSGQPAAQLGAGSAPSSEQEALDVLFNSPALSTGIKNALRRILDPRDPQVIAVDNDGTPTELASTRTQRDDARTELSNERDENHAGSLKAQLVAAQAAAATPADTVAKATVLPLIEAVEQAASQLDTHLMSSHIDGIDTLETAVVAAKNAVS